MKGQAHLARESKEQGKKGSVRLPLEMERLLLVHNISQ